MISRCHRLVNLASVALLLCFTNLLFGFAQAAADDKTRLGNDTIERVSDLVSWLRHTWVESLDGGRMWFMDVWRWNRCEYQHFTSPIKILYL